MIPAWLPVLAAGTAAAGLGYGWWRHHRRRKAGAGTESVGTLAMGLARTRSGWLDRLKGAFGAGGLEAAQWEELEALLVGTDMGLGASQALLDALKQRAAREGLRDFEAFRAVLAAEIERLVAGRGRPLEIDASKRPFVILVIGVNGVGKTTTIGKLARRFKQQGHSVLLAAGDTFRAGAIDQLGVWGERNGIEVIRQQEGSDAAAVIHDAVQAARNRGVDVLIADTAGRLHTKVNLMEELRKVHRVAGKVHAGAPHEVLLVLDATTGQNALAQLDQFHRALPVTGLALTKLDGTPKGGILVAIAREHDIPFRFIGVGERAEDLIAFDPQAYARGLVGL